MIKSFSGLWLVVFAPLFFLLYPHAYNPIHHFNEEIEKQRFMNNYQGTLLLIEQELLNTPKANWPQTIDAMAAQFGFQLALKNTSSFGDKTQEQLNQGSTVFVNREPERLIKKLSGSHYTLSLALDMTPEEEIRRGAMGSVALLKAAFDKVSSDAWLPLSEELSQELHYHLLLAKKTDITLDKTQEVHLRQYGFFWRPLENGQLAFYIPLKDGNTFLIADAIPVESFDELDLIYLFLIFILIISLCMFAWVSPLWRDLGKLKSATKLYGSGDLKPRIQLSGTSPVYKLGQTLNDMAQRIESLLEGQRQLTNAIAHDLRNPLYRLRFAFEMLNDEDTQADEAIKYRRSAEKSIQVLDSLINQTLVLARYSNQQQVLKPEATSLAKMLSDEIEVIALESHHLNIQMKVSPALYNHSFALDGKALLRAFNNLIANACRFAMNKVDVTLNLDSQTHQFTLEVEDDGPGIDKKDRESIFIPFSQLENKQRDTSKGHGLGLAIVKEIARAHGGNIQVARSSMGGAKFTLSWYELKP